MVENAKNFWKFKTGGHKSGALTVNWWARERRLAWKKGVMTAAHPHTPFQCECPPRQVLYCMVQSETDLLSQVVYEGLTIAKKWLKMRKKSNLPKLGRVYIPIILVSQLMCSMVHSSVASPICQEVQNERTYLIFAFSSRFFSFFWIFSDFRQIFRCQGWHSAPLSPPVATPLMVHKIALLSLRK